MGKGVGLNLHFKTISVTNASVWDRSSKGIRADLEGVCPGAQAQGCILHSGPFINMVSEAPTSSRPHFSPPWLFSSLLCSTSIIGLPVSRPTTDKPNTNASLYLFRAVGRTSLNPIRDHQNTMTEYNHTEMTRTPRTGWRTVVYGKVDGKAFFFFYLMQNKNKS